MYSGETARVTADGTQIVVDTRTDHELMLDFKYGIAMSHGWVVVLSSVLW